MKKFILLGLLGGALSSQPTYAQLKKTFDLISTSLTEINPTQSSLDATSPNGASGGRVNHVAISPDGNTALAATEWGGIYKSLDAGQNWFRLEKHLPNVSWDVAIHPEEDKLYIATSYYDGRTNSFSGINISKNGGSSWIHPPTALPPEGFCTATRRNEPTGFGIGIDPDNPDWIYVGTNCGLAVSDDQGDSWAYVDPTPDDPATDIWDVVVHDDGTIDIVGDDGHFRSTDNGANWATATGVPLPGGRSTIAVSPNEADVLYATVGTTIFESVDGGDNWIFTLTNPRPQGRFPFVKTNKRGGNNYDLWFGDVRLNRCSCTTPANTNSTARRCPQNSWSADFSTPAGAHNDMGDMVFDPTSATNACPILVSNDGGVYVNTNTAAGCQSPSWEQPQSTPRALWVWGMDGAKNGANKFLHFGNQDNGPYGTSNSNALNPNWLNPECCDGFDTHSDANNVLYSVCCWSPGRGNRLFRRNPGMTGGGQLPAADYASNAGIPAFRYYDAVVDYGNGNWAVLHTDGLYITTNINASPVVWTEIGNAPGNAVGVKVVMNGGTPSFFLHTNNNQVWRYDGTNGDSWTQVQFNGAGGTFEVFDVSPGDPDLMIAARLDAAGTPTMQRSTDGGANWTALGDLDNLMTANGNFAMAPQRGLKEGNGNAIVGFNGYIQPTLVQFDPNDPRIVVAGAADAGLFISLNRGASWHLLVKPPANQGITGPLLGELTINNWDIMRPDYRLEIIRDYQRYDWKDWVIIPELVKQPKVALPLVANLPRPRFAYFDHYNTNLTHENVHLYIGTVGRGVWRLNLKFRKNAFTLDIHPDLRECIINPECWIRPEWPEIDILCPGGPPCPIVVDLGDLCRDPRRCPDCSRMLSCPPIWEFDVQGMDPREWNFVVFDPNNEQVPVELEWTDKRQTKIRFMPDEKIWKEQRLKGYRLGVAATKENKIRKSRIQLKAAIVQDDLGNRPPLKQPRLGLDRK